jgi:hypothetical protein
MRDLLSLNISIYEGGANAKKTGGGLNVDVGLKIHTATITAATCTIRRFHNGIMRGSEPHLADSTITDFAQIEGGAM